MPRKQQPAAQFPTLTVTALVLGAAFILSGVTIPALPFGPSPTPEIPELAPRPGDPDLLADFAANANKAEAREHAAALCDICRQIASALRFDGRQEPANQRIKQGVHVAALRNDIRVYALENWAFTAKYPSLKSSVANFLDAAAGRDAQELSPEQREKWASAHEAIARAAYAAERKL